MKFFIRIFILIFALSTNAFAKENQMVNKETIVCIETNQGTIEVKLFPEVAPKACENFVTHVNNHYYDGIIFHRVIKQFMLQCGDPTGTGAGGPFMLE